MVKLGFSSDLDFSCGDGWMGGENEIKAISANSLGNSGTRTQGLFYTIMAC